MPSDLLELGPASDVASAQGTVCSVATKPAASRMNERGVHIPRASMVMDYVIQMVHGDKSVCPKGGRPEYRNQPWYEQSAPS